MSLGFVRNPLLRHAAERDEAHTAAQARDPAAATIVFAGEAAILAVRDGAVTALLPRALLDGLAPAEQAYLGTLEGRPVFAALVAPEAAERFGEPHHRALDLRAIALGGTVPPDELGMLAQGKALLHWHRAHRYCGFCGTATRATAGGARRDCPSCARQHFPRTDPVVIMLVARDEGCLLGRQPRFPPGMYSCLAGFMEPGETVEDAVRRETSEEAGVAVGAVRYLASQPWPFPSSLMIGCVAEALGDALTLDREELEDGRWFTRDEVRLMLERRHPQGLFGPAPMAIAHHLMRWWVDGSSGA